MSRVRWMSGVIAVVTGLICSPAFATAYTSNNSGDWNVPATWAPAGIPALGDTVTITGSHVITVSDARGIDFITFLTNSGGKELHVTSTGSLTVAGSGAAIQLNPSSDGVNLLQLEGGTVTLTDPLGSVNVVGGALSIAQIRFTSLGGTLTIARSLNFAGTAVNADVIFDAGSNGTLEIGGDLNAGGNITTAGSNGTFTFNGSGNSQTINDYSFQNLTINKTSGTATLNGTGTAVVNGNLTIASGVLDDGGNQINLDSGLGSMVSIGTNGVLKLGSAANGTSFPNPVTPINVSLASNSAVVYQSGNSQSVDTSFSYKRLFLQTLGGPVLRSFVNQTFLTVLEELFIDSPVTASFDNDLLDVNGDITGNGTVQLLNSVSPGNVQVTGDWATGALSSAPGTTVTYDGSGPQTMLGATYQNLTINKPSGDATVNSSANVFGNLNLTNGNIVVNLSFTIDVAANVTRTSGHFIGPLTMGLNPTPTRRFDVGTAASYLPVDVDAGSAGVVTIQAVEGPHPNNTGINTLDRYWSIVAPSTAAPLDLVQFNYNDPGDITNGTETRFHLARYSGGIWTDFGDIPEAFDNALVTTPAPYLGDWVIGQKGSVGFAGKVAITSVNGGTDPTVNVGFPVEVETRHDDDTPANVTINTGIDIVSADRDRLAAQWIRHRQCRDQHGDGQQLHVRHHRNGHPGKSGRLLRRHGPRRRPERPLRRPGPADHPDRHHHRRQRRRLAARCHHPLQRRRLPGPLRHRFRFRRHRQHHPGHPAAGHHRHRTAHHRRNHRLRIPAEHECIRPAARTASSPSRSTGTTRLPSASSSRRPTSPSEASASAGSTSAAPAKRSRSTTSPAAPSPATTSARTTPA